MALYLPDYNVLFLQIPFTHSNLIAEALEHTVKVKVEEVGRTYAHKDLVGTLRFEREPYTVAFVRNPLDWYAAFWRTRTKPQGGGWGLEDASGAWGPTWELDSRCADDSFAGFLDKATDRGGFLAELYSLYTGRGTADEIEFVGKSETLLADVCTLFDTVGIPYRPRALRSLDRHTEWREMYTPELEATVAHAEREVFASYGYPPPPVEDSLIAQARAARPMTLDDVPGWFAPVDQELFRLFLEWQVRTQPLGDLVELGVYFGKSAILIGEWLQDGETFTVCDLFGDEAPETSNAAENDDQYRSLTRQQFELNYQRFHRALPVIHQMTTQQAALLIGEGTCRFVHVDASHLYRQIAADVETARRILRPDGVVAFDDFRSQHTPGVAAAVWEAMFAKGLNPIVLTPMKWYGTWDDPTPARHVIRDWAERNPNYLLETTEIAGNEVLRVHERRAHQGTPGAGA